MIPIGSSYILRFTTGLLCIFLNLSCIPNASGQSMWGQRVYNKVLHDSKNHITDELRFFINQPLDFTLQRFTKFYNYRLVKEKKRVSAAVRQYVVPELQRYRKGKKRESLKSIELFFTDNFILRGDDHLMVCLGRENTLFSIFLVYPNDEGWLKFKWLAQQIPYKRSTTYLDEKGKMSNTSIAYTIHRKGMGVEGLFTLDKWLSKSGKVTLLKADADFSWGLNLPYIIELLKNNKAEFDQYLSKSESLQEKNYNKIVNTLKTSSNDFIALIKLDSMYHQTLCRLVYVSKKVSFKEWQKVKVDLQGAKIIYQKPGLVYYIPDKTGKLTATFSLKRG